MKFGTNKKMKYQIEMLDFSQHLKKPHSQTNGNLRTSTACEAVAIIENGNCSLDEEHQQQQSKAELEQPGLTIPLEEELDFIDNLTM